MKLILIALLSLLLICRNTAWAEGTTCAAKLLPTFTAQQARAICTQIKGTFAIAGNQTVAGTLAVTGATTLTGLATLNGQLALGSESVAGAGTTVADAAALSAATGVHRITGANGTVGWKFVVGTPIGSHQILLNTTAGVAKVYGESGSTVNGAAADAAFSALTGIKPIICVKTAALTYLCA